jgi:type IV pilus assembly protein PilC
VARRSQFVSAMIYPGVLSFAALFVIVFLLTFVLPRLSEVFKNLGGSLPTPTKILLGAADFITANWLWLLIAPIVVAAIYRGWVATEAGAVYRDRLLLRLPGAGRILSKAVVSRLARTLGTLLYGGVPILEALRLSGESCGNRFIQRSAVAAAQDVREGRPLHEALTDAGGFPGVLTHMVAIGEETGDLPKMLDRVSDTLDFEVDTGMRRLTSVFEPLVVIVMGTFVGFVVLSVLLPIFEAQSWLK